MTNELNPLDSERLAREAAESRPMRVGRLALRPVLGGAVLMLAYVGSALSGTASIAGLSWHSGAALLVAAAGYVGIATLGLRVLGRGLTGSGTSGAASGVAAATILLAMHAWPQMAAARIVVQSGVVGGVALWAACRGLAHHDA
ncbi:MAG TPA: hypothetical protein VMF70_00935 [Gemmatimonadales bacterium]|nr:hypothetical protein [Gemmatimonadales bacterium]HUK73549.1 hypothetical protein [Streptosporangiaceae bacterium]